LIDIVDVENLNAIRPGKPA